jgi:hypothetical protein
MRIREGVIFRIGQGIAPRIREGMMGTSGRMQMRKRGGEDKGRNAL